MWVVDIDSPNACSTQLQPKIVASLVLVGGVVPYNGVTLLPPMVCRRQGKVTCQVSRCSKTMPLG